MIEIHFIMALFLNFTKITFIRERGRKMKISKVISIAMVLVGIIVFFIGLEILGIILAVVGLFFFPKSSTTSSLDSFVDDDHYYENNTKNDESDSAGSDGNDKD